jgi:hypothetical protein
MTDAKRTRAKRARFLNEVKGLPRRQGQALVADAVAHCEPDLAPMRLATVLAAVSGRGRDYANNVCDAHGLSNAAIGSLSAKDRTRLADGLVHDSRDRWRERLVSA